MNTFKLIGFDLDGTLVNSLPDLALSLSQAFAEVGLPPVPESTFMTWIGQGVDVLFAHALEWEGRDLSAEDVASLKSRFSHFYGQNVCTLSQLYPNVIATLDTLIERGYTLALVTNKPTIHVQPVLEAFTMAHYFAESLGGQSLPAIKPHPAPLYYLCGKFGCHPKELLFVGDSSNDILAAQSAGCPCVGMTYGYNYNVPIADSRPDYVFDDVADILTIC